MAPSRTPLSELPHAQGSDQIIHTAEIRPLSRLLEPLDPPVPNLDAALMVETLELPGASSPSYSPSVSPITTPEGSPVTPPAVLTTGHAENGSVLPPAAGTANPRKRERVDNGEDEGEEDLVGRTCLKKVKRHTSQLTSHNVSNVAAAAAAAGLKRKRDGDGNEEDEESEKLHKKKTKPQHPHPHLQHHEHPKPTDLIPHARAARSFKQQNARHDSLAQRTERCRRYIAGGGSSEASKTPPWERSAGTDEMLDGNGDVPSSPARPLYSPITPSLLPQYRLKSQVDMLRDGTAAGERMLLGDDTLPKINEWDREVQWTEEKGPCRLPGLKELGLDTLYVVGQMREGNGRGCRCSHLGDGVGGRADGTGSGSAAVRPRDFWSVV